MDEPQVEDSPRLIELKRMFLSSSSVFLPIAFTGLDRRSLAYCIRVCPEWFGPAAQSLWHTIECPEILFSLLPAAVRNKHDVCLYVCIRSWPFYKLVILDRKLKGASHGRGLTSMLNTSKGYLSLRRKKAICTMLQFTERFKT